MNAQLSDSPTTHDPHAELERELIAEYLRIQCPRKDGLRGLPEATVRQLMTEASCYASARLAELELRARWVEKVHGTVEPGQLG
jgi:hypothetical protein